MATHDSANDARKATRRVGLRRYGRWLLPLGGCGVLALVGALALASRGTTVNQIEALGGKIESRRIVGSNWQEFLNTLRGEGSPMVTVVGGVDLAHTRADNGVLRRLRDFPHLSTLNLVETDVSDEGMRYVPTTVRELLLGHTSIGDEGLAHLKRLGRLASLHLDNSRITDDGLAHVVGLPLKDLFLRYTAVTDAGVAYLEDMRQLSWLALTGTTVSDRGLQSLAGLKKLEALELDRTCISDEGLAHLRGFPALRRLYISGTGISDRGLAHLSELVALETLNVNETKVTKTAVARLQRARPGLRVIMEAD